MKGDPFFTQERPGKDEKIFKLIKFRSMTEEKDENGDYLPDEVRLSSYGKKLRSSSLDELPELFNVLKGEMSLVGPRPLPVDETKHFDDISHRRRLSVRPGMTCLWQISGRNNITDFKEWVRLDLEYIDNWSFWGDIMILIKTIPVVFRGLGAK